MFKSHVCFPSIRTQDPAAKGGRSNYETRARHVTVSVAQNIDGFVA